jgi:hypothetical protein
LTVHETQQRKDLPQDIRLSLKGANVFYTDEYQRFIKGPNRELVYLHNGDFIVPVTITTKLSFRYADLATEPYSLARSGSQESEAHFINEAVQYLKDSVKIMWIRQTPVTALFPAYPNGSVRIPFGSYVIDLTKTEDAIWSAFSSKYRQYGRQCREAGGIVKEGGVDLLDDFYSLLVASMSRAEAGIEPKDYYRKMLVDLQPYAKLFVAYRDSKPEAAVLLLFNEQMSYTFYGGISASPHKGSNVLLYWEAIRWMKSAGVRSFSFVGCRINVDPGSKYAGIQTFKERFGGELRRGFMFKTVQDPLRMKAFSLLQRFRMALKGSGYSGDIIDQEIHKWEELQSTTRSGPAVQ